MDYTVDDDDDDDEGNASLLRLDAESEFNQLREKEVISVLIRED